MDSLSDKLRRMYGQIYNLYADINRTENGFVEDIKNDGSLIGRIMAGSKAAAMEEEARKNGLGMPGGMMCSMPGSMPGGMGMYGGMMGGAMGMGLGMGGVGGMHISRTDKLKMPGMGMGDIGGMHSSRNMYGMHPMMGMQETPEINTQTQYDKDTEYDYLFEQDEDTSNESYNECNETQYDESYLEFKECIDRILETAFNADPNLRQYFDPDVYSDEEIKQHIIDLINAFKSADKDSSLKEYLKKTDKY